MNHTYKENYKYYLIILLLGGVLYPLWGHIYSYLFPNLKHFVLGRYTVAAITILTPYMLLKTSYFHKSIKLSFYFGLYNIIFTTYYLFWKNNLSQEYLIGSMIAFFCARAVILHRKEVFYYIGVNFLVTLFLAAFTKSGEAVLLFAAVLSLSIIELVVLSVKEKNISKMFEMSSFFSMNESPVIRFNNEGKLLMHNDASEELLMYWKFKDGYLTGAWKNLITKISNENYTRYEKVSYKSKIFRLKFVPLQEYNYVNIYAEDITSLEQQTKIIMDQKETMKKTARYNELGVMAASIAHEINNPLTIISGRAEQLKKISHKFLEDPIKYKGMVEKSTSSIIETVSRIARIVNALRSLSQDGEHEKPHDVNISETIVNTLEFCNSRIKKADVELTVDIAENLVVECRSVEISQVLLNLINNAVDAISGREERWVRVSAEILDDKIKITIEDSGPGVPSELKQKIFDAFFTTKGVGTGTGLGLSISSDIIRSHSGMFYIDDECVNTKFVIILPRQFSEGSSSPYLKETA